MANFFRKFLPESTVQSLRRAFLFRPEDPNNLHQVLPPKVVNTTVERIKGNRWPSPGSRLGASIPTRESEDEIYNTNYYPKDPRNMKTNNSMFINSGKNPVYISTDTARVDSHGKRKITLFPYDASGLRTTKTTTWGAVAPLLDANAPTHLPMPEWWNESEEIDKEREKKGLPPAVGRRYKAQMSANYTEVRW